MTITLEFSWWTIPTIITMLGTFWAIFIVKDDCGYLSGLSNVLALGFVMAISCFAWAIAGFLK